MGRLHEESTEVLFFFGGQGCISLGFKIGGILLVIKSEKTIFPALRSVLTVLSCCKDYHCLLTAGLDQEALVWVLKIGPLSFLGCSRELDKNCWAHGKIQCLELQELQSFAETHIKVIKAYLEVQDT